jgi:hypothetical protein
MNVKLLFLNAYRYQHRNTEIWSNGCLVKIESDTRENSKVSYVNGRKQGSLFFIETRKQRRKVAGCIRTFAYWDKNFLKADRLLNPQTGKVVAVKVRKLEDETLTNGEISISAEKYQLTFQGHRIDLWYSKSGRWLSLESTTVTGKRLRYLRVQEVSAL